MQVTLPETACATTTSAASFHDRALERLAALPGVVAAGAAARVPIEGTYLNPSRTIQIETRPALNGETRTVDDIGVTAGYLETLRVPRRAGRFFASADGAGAPLVTVISETVARRYWGEESPLGARVRLGDEPSPDAWRTVIGIAGDIRNDIIDMPPPAYVYIPTAQRPTREMTIMIRTSDDPLSHVAAARAAISAEDPDLPVYDIQSMDQLLSQNSRGRAVLSSMTGVFAGLALLLAAVGIYGMVAYTVAERTREIAVRIAVGARRHHVIRHILTGGLGAVLAGLVLGLAGSIAVSQLLTVVLYGVSPSDPMSYALVTGVLAGSALLACVLPAQRALRLDPVVALRHE
jgi:putative ABC transport system permease protein